MKLLSWNVNGIRAAYKKGSMNIIDSANPDILCIQETKAHEKQLPVELKNIQNYHAFYSSPEKKGYSGVAIYSKEQPANVYYNLGIEKFDKEGRIIAADYNEFILFNVYFPNGKASKERLEFKMEFYFKFLDQINEFRLKGKKIIFCGDVNTAHKPIDLARPKENEKVSGFLPEERAWIDRVIESEYFDTFRLFNQDPDHYTWWDMKTKARERNVGWRIDYFFISKNLQDKLKSSFILSQIMGSDHCPIGIEIDL